MLNFKPAGYHILIRPDYEKETKSGLIIVENDRVGVAAVDVGTVVAIGPTAWKAYDNGQPWCEVGDRVGYAKWGGKLIWDKDHPDEKYVLLADGDIRVVFNREEQVND